MSTIIQSSILKIKVLLFYRSSVSQLLVKCSSFLSSFCRDSRSSNSEYLKIQLSPCRFESISHNPFSTLQIALIELMERFELECYFFEDKKRFIANKRGIVNFGKTKKCQKYDQTQKWSQKQNKNVDQLYAATSTDHHTSKKQHKPLSKSRNKKKVGL